MEARVRKALLYFRYIKFCYTCYEYNKIITMESQQTLDGCMTLLLYGRFNEHPGLYIIIEFTNGNIISRSDCQ